MEENNEQTNRNPAENQLLSLTNDNGLWIDPKSNTVLGYLFNFQGRVYSPDGKVELTPEQADVHNKLLSRGEILGLDNNCQIGQRGTFYYRSGSVNTWVGELVSDRVTVNGQVITFRRNGKVFRGRLQKDADCFNFRRIG